MARKPSRRRVPCASERRGETSSAAVAAMNSRRFIRSSRSLRTTGRRVSRLDCGRTHCGCKYCVANAARGARRLWVKPGNTRWEQMFSALPPTTDIERPRRHVRSVPGAEIRSYALASPHSITSSARARSASGTSMPNALAVLRLTARNICVGNSIGKFPGAIPRKILSTK